MDIVAKPLESVGADQTGGAPKPIATWHSILAGAWRDPSAFCRELNLPDEVAIAAAEGQGAFRLFCPQPLADKIRPGDLNDPILRQVLPTVAELDFAWPSENEFSTGEAGLTADGKDPLLESQFELAPGVLQKYAGRALLVMTGACAVHCRYCFRRFFPYEKAPKGVDDWTESLESIRLDPSIHEVILSGGDPLTLRDEVLGALVTEIASMKHVRRLRIHTRLPIVIPQRVTLGLVELLATTRLDVVVVVHANCAEELGDDVEAALLELRTCSTAILNQSVLLRGVNDNVKSLIALSERLIQCGVIPYYLHQMDRVSGARHFHVPIETGQALVGEMRQRTSGYLVPRYVVEQPGAPFKTPLETTRQTPDE